MLESHRLHIDHLPAKFDIGRQMRPRMRVLPARNAARIDRPKFGNHIHQPTFQLDLAGLDQRQKAGLDDDFGHRSQIKARINPNLQLALVRIKPAPGLIH